MTIFKYPSISIGINSIELIQNNRINRIQFIESMTKLQLGEGNTSGNRNINVLLLFGRSCFKSTYFQNPQKSTKSKQL